MSVGYAEIAITSVLNSEKSFCKFLSANDTGATGAHQSGILISKTAMEMLFSREQLEQEGIPKRTVKIKWQNDFETESCFTYYASKNELRITRFGRGFPFLHINQTGSLFVFTKQAEENYSGYFLDTEEEIEEFLNAFGISPTETNSLINVENVRAEAQEQIAIQEFIANLEVDFPTSEEMSATARYIQDRAYFVIYSEKYIFPPDIRKKLSIDYLNALLHFVPEGELASIMPRSRQDRIVVFEIHQPSGQTHLVGMYIKGGMLKETSLEKVEELQPLLMERADKKFLMKRVTEQDSENYKNRILIIGCGSIGGHVICELAKAGYEDLTIVDYEKLTEENIFRHVLGMEYVNRYKCEALNTYIQKNIPEVKITTLAERIEDAITEEDINFEDYNLIISAAGNHNLNRWINSWIQNNKIKVPVVYLWNEVYGIGNHAAYIKYGNCGCYECFFDRDEETGELYDKTSYCMRGQIITESAGGCGKTYVPYGNLVSLKTMLLCLKMVKNIFEENLDDNLLISLKGDSDYLEKHNLETSGRYLRQQEQIKILTGKQFVNINCGVCNDCNGK